MVFVRRTALVWIVAILLLVGCTGSGGQNPTTPSTTSQLIQSTSATATGSRYIWEMGDVTINPDAGTATVVPDRTADWNVNILKFLQPPDGNSANLSVAITNFDAANKIVTLNCTITNPFPSGSIYWGFDTRVVVFAGGSTTGKHDATVKYPTTGELRMTNADGYTRWFNRTEFGPIDKIFGYTEGKMAPSFTPTSWSTINGYKYFATGITPTQMPPNPTEAQRGSIASGSVTRQMILAFPKSAPKPFQFKYSVDTNWLAPTANPPSSVSVFPAAATLLKLIRLL